MEFNVAQFLDSAFIVFVVLGLGALAGYFCERVGIVNIAIDGQMIFGALIFSIFAMLLGQSFGELKGFMILVPLVCSMAISILLSWLYGLLVIKIKANHVISGTAINLVVAGIATFITQPLGSAISNGVIPKLKVDYIPGWKIVDGFYGETILILVIALLLIGLSIFLVNKTRFGLRFKAIGDNPNAVDAQGVNVNRYKWIGMMISGVFGAIAGSIFMLGGNKLIGGSGFFEGNVAGLGFLSIAIVVFGSWRIPFITLASLVFAGLMSVMDMITINAEGWSYINKLLKAVPFVGSLIILIIFSRKGFGPKALGKHFDKTLR